MNPTEKQLTQADAYFTQAMALSQSNQFEHAISYFEKALQLNPRFTGVYNEVGNMLSRIGWHEKAIVHFHKALEIEPYRHEILHNMAYAYYRQGQFEEAINWYQQALALAPDFHHSRVGLGCSLQSLGRFDEALACYQMVLNENSEHVDALWNMVLALLLKGDYSQGWPAYEWRYKVLPEFATRRFKAPVWDGTPLTGKRILVMAEQGAGDTFQFLRFLPKVKELGGKVIFACQKDLRCLFNTIESVDEIITQEETETLAYDTYVYLMSLPGLFKTQVESIPSVLNPIKMPAEIKAQWQNYFKNKTGLKIGITWSGNPELQYNTYRALDPANYETLLVANPNIQLFSLQKCPPIHLSLPNALNAHPRFHDLAPELADWCQTAAAMNELDLIISIDTAVAHLAATLGKSTWIILPFAGDWRWLRGRLDSPWYPDNVRLFRQPAFADWSSVFKMLNQALIETE